MSTLLSQTRPFLEAGAFLATIVLAAGLLVAWRQLSHIRKDTKIRVLREAKQHAITACEDYLRSLCDEPFLSMEVCEKYGIYKGEIGDFSFVSLDDKALLSVQQKASEDCYRVGLNHLEVIASKFTSGVADEQTGFEIIGRSFCFTVEAQYDSIAADRSNSAAPYWKNIVELYGLWRPRLEGLELERALTSANDKLASLQRPSPRNPTGI